MPPEVCDLPRGIFDVLSGGLEATPDIADVLEEVLDGCLLLDTPRCEKLESFELFTAAESQNYY